MAAPVFVGRERELAQLQTRFEQAVTGHQGQVVFVSGEAGTGKSALLQEFARRVQLLSVPPVIAVGTCNAYTGLGDPYLPFREILALLTGDVEAKLAQGQISPETAGRLQAVVVHSIQILVDVAPDLINVLVPGAQLLAKIGQTVLKKAGWLEKLEQLVRYPRPQLPKGELAAEQSRLFEQVTAFLCQLAQEQPLVLVLDDLHWADAASISLLFHLGRRIHAARILLLGAYRADEVAMGREGERHPLDKVLVEFKRYFGDIELDLRQAMAAEGQQFVEALLDRQPNQLGVEFRRALFEQTEGHPLFTVELLQALQQRGDLREDETGRWVAAAALDWQALPARVEGVIEERIARLEENHRQLLSVASVEGEDFTAQVIARVQEVRERQVLQALSQELEKRQRLVYEEGERQVGRHYLARYRFVHGLFQHYLYHELGAGERRMLHGEIARVLEELYQERLDDVLLPLAMHYELAGLPQEAVVYYHRAAVAAQRIYAHIEAIHYLSKAISLCEQVPQAAPPIPLYQDRGLAYEILGEFDKARADQETALKLAQAAGDRHVEWRALLNLGELWTSRSYAQTGEYVRQALALARTLEDPVALAHSLNRMGNWQANVEQFSVALGCHQEALSIFQALNHRHGLATTLDLLGNTTLLTTDTVKAADYFEQAIALFQELDERQGLVSCLSTFVGCGMMTTQSSEVAAASKLMAYAAAGELAVKLAAEIGWRTGEAVALGMLARHLGGAGDYARALPLAERALAVAAEIGHREWMAHALDTLGVLSLDLLALPAARQQLERAWMLATESGAMFHVYSSIGYLASTYVLQHELDRAEAALDAAPPFDAATPTVAQRLVLCARAEWALARDEPARAFEIVEQLIVSAAHASAENVIPRLWSLRGEALAALQRWPEAEEALQVAQTTARAQGARPRLWRIHMALGRLYAAQTRQPEAEHAYTVAKAIVEELATNLPDITLRETFQHGANVLLPHP